MESILKRAAPYFELLCFLAAWAAGISMAMGGRGEAARQPQPREVVAGDPERSTEEPLRHRTFRPVRIEEIEEGG